MTKKDPRKINLVQNIVLWSTHDLSQLLKTTYLFQEQMQANCLSLLQCDSNNCLSFLKGHTSLRENNIESNEISRNGNERSITESTIAKHQLLLNCLSGSIAHDVRLACAEITGIANFLSSRKENQKNISEWHILAAVLGYILYKNVYMHIYIILDRVLLMIFAATFLFGSFYFYSEIGRHPVPDHPFQDQFFFIKFE